MDKLDKLKLASSSFGERLKTGGAQMSRIVSTKVKEILQSPTPESKMVDEATAENMEEPNWGLNLRICAMISREEFNGTEIVKAIKKKLTGKSPVSQRLSLDLLEACTSNCEKVFSEVASEKVLDDMVKMIDDPKADLGNRRKAWELIRAWGETDDLIYLPVFHQTYMSLRERMPLGARDEDAANTQYTLESYIDQELMSPPEHYPAPDTGLHGADDITFPSTRSIEENKEFLVVTRNSLDLLSSILNSETEPKPIKEDLTVSLLEKCKQSLPVVRRIAESTVDDEPMLFEALNLHDELQDVVSRYQEMEAAMEAGGQLLSEEPDNMRANSLVEVDNHSETKREHALKGESTKTDGETEKAALPKENAESSTK